MQPKDEESTGAHDCHAPAKMIANYQLKVKENALFASCPRFLLVSMCDSALETDQ